MGAADAVAASLVLDCLYFGATAQTLPDRAARSTDAGALVEVSKDASVLLHAGQALLNQARTTQRPTTTDAVARRLYEESVIPIARKATELLFAAADAGAAGAYEQLGILSMQFGRKLGDDPLAARLREKDNWEWLEVGAQQGDWAAQCRVADAAMNRLRREPYTREAFNAAVKLARQCIDRREPPVPPLWYSHREWLVVAPRLPRERRPVLQIASTSALLNGLLFFDQDRRLNNAPAASKDAR
jgi:hypothetical protein